MQRIWRSTFAILFGMDLLDQVLIYIANITASPVQVSPEWPGLPIGVKFDPSDAELLEHLAAKCGAGNSRPHLFIDEFIPTLEEDQGICYTHPENLPGQGAPCFI